MVSRAKEALISAAVLGCCTAVVLLPIVLGAQADPPVNTGREPVYARVGAPVNGRNVAVGTTTGIMYSHVATGLDGGSLVQDSGAADPRHFAVITWGTTLVIDCALEAYFCWTMDDDVTIGSGTSAGIMTDPNATIPNAGSDNRTSASCFHVLPGIPRQVVALQAMWGPQGLPLAATRPAGYRIASCLAGGNSGPCDDNSDCVTASGTTPDAGSCNLPDGGSLMPRGMLLAHIAPAATNCFVSEEL